MARLGLDVALFFALWHVPSNATGQGDKRSMPNFAARRTMMVDTQVRPSDVTKFPIIDAMLSVPRELYVHSAQREIAYMGENIEISPGRVMLEPRTLSKMLDVLNIEPDDVVLDLGCAMGYSTAVMAHLAQTVVAVEEDPDTAREAQALLSEQGVDNAAVLEGPLAEGAARHGPYDVIFPQGAVEVVPPVLLEQLKEGGRIGCIFMEGVLGVARVGHKIDGHITWRFAFNASAPVLPGFARKEAFTL